MGSCPSAPLNESDPNVLCTGQQLHMLTYRSNQNYASDISPHTMEPSGCLFALKQTRRPVHSMHSRFISSALSAIHLQVLHPASLRRVRPPYRKASRLPSPHPPHSAKPFPNPRGHPQNFPKLNTTRNRLIHDKVEPYSHLRCGALRAFDARSRPWRRRGHGYGWNGNEHGHVKQQYSSSILFRPHNDCGYRPGVELLFLS